MSNFREDSRLVSYDQDKRDYLYLFGFAFVVLIFLIANPGYFSHDELQKLDYIKELGFGSYFDAYVALRQGSNFGVPVRPFSFLVQGGLSYFMENYAVLVHLVAVVTHAIVACLLYTILKRLGARRELALTIALVFIMNPLGILATGWSAALMDRWYILYGLAVFICVDKYVRGHGKGTLLFWAFLWSCLSILSKETAVILPALIFIILLVDPQLFRSKRFWYALIVWCLPILLFMLYRLPALIASFGNPDVGAYKASITNVPEGILIYLAYPFLVFTAEAGNWVFVTKMYMAAALGLHALLCVAVARIYGLKAILVYVCGYFLFLAPVLLIPIKASHYLYGSSLILSIGVGLLISQKWRDFPVPKLIGFGSFILLLAHSIVNQDFVYSLGRCMNSAMITTESAYESSSKPLAVNFQAEPGAAEHVLYRMVTGRNRIGSNYALELSVSKWGETPPENTLSLRMDINCVVHSKPD